MANGEPAPAEEYLASVATGSPLETDAEMLARAVLRGDLAQAYPLADEVIARAKEPDRFMSRGALQLENAALKECLKRAILSTSRTTRRVIDCDPAAGSTYEIDWLPDVKAWAALCGLDLSKHDPPDRW